jgi:hypothetical protein
LKAANDIGDDCDYSVAEQFGEQPWAKDRERYAGVLSNKGQTLYPEFHV